MFWRGWTVPSANYLPLNLLKHMGLEVTLPMRRTSILYACLVWLHFPWRPEQMFSAFHKLVFFFFPPLTCSRQQCYICILYFVSFWLRLKRNWLIYSTTGKVEQCFRMRSAAYLYTCAGVAFQLLPSRPILARLGFGVVFKSLQTTYFSAKQKMRICVLLLSFIFFHIKEHNNQQTLHKVTVEREWV